MDDFKFDERWEKSHKKELASDGSSPRPNVFWTFFATIPKRILGTGWAFFVTTFREVPKACNATLLVLSNAAVIAAFVIGQWNWLGYFLVITGIAGSLAIIYGLWQRRGRDVAAGLLWIGICLVAALVSERLHTELRRSANHEEEAPLEAELSEFRLQFGPKESDIIRGIWARSKVLENCVIPPKGTARSDVDAVFGTPTSFVEKRPEGPWDGPEPPFYIYTIQSEELMVSYVDEKVDVSMLPGPWCNGPHDDVYFLCRVWALRRILAERAQPLKLASWNRKVRDIVGRPIFPSSPWPDTLAAP